LTIGRGRGKGKRRGKEEILMWRMWTR